MPSAIPLSPVQSGITKFTNCRLLLGDELVKQDLWVSSNTGKIIGSQAAFYDHYIMPDEIVNLGGRILAPGLIECQLNGAFGFNFSTTFDDMQQYGKKVKALNRALVQTGVTSYVPTVTTQTSDLYKKVLPYLAPSGHHQVAQDGAESLGAHVEGPFLSPTKNGIHNVQVMREASTFSDLEDCYGASNLVSTPASPCPIRYMTAAPELGNMTSLIPELAARGITFSIGHTEATYEEASLAVAAGARMITHLFNAMRPLHHRNPGVFGVLGAAAPAARPYFGVIADGIHLHPTTVRIAYNAHPDGFVLVTDAMHMVGLPDGSYEWTNGDNFNTIVKQGNVLLLEGDPARIAGSSTTLVECVNHFLAWTGAGVAAALRCVTATPAAMLGLAGVKGTLDEGADADLVVLSDEVDTGTAATTRLVVDEVWKFGTRVFARERPAPASKAERRQLSLGSDSGVSTSSSGSFL